MVDKVQVQKQLKGKLRKFFRSKRREYFWLGFRGNQDELATKLPLKDYEEFVADLTYSEFYEFFSIFQNEKRVTELMAITDICVWIRRCFTD